MCKFIGVEILAANAFIEILENKKETKLSVNQLEKYAMKVNEFLRKTYKEQMVVIYSENQTGNRILNFSKYFEVTNDTIILRDNVTLDELRKRFRAPLTYKMLKAFLCDDVKRTIICV